MDFVMKTSKLEEQMALKNQQRLVPDGVSVFDLIMNWKTEIKKNESVDENLKKKGLAKVVKCHKKKDLIPNFSLGSHFSFLVYLGFQFL